MEHEGRSLLASDQQQPEQLVVQKEPAGGPGCLLWILAIDVLAAAVCLLTYWLW